VKADPGPRVAPVLLYFLSMVIMQTSGTAPIEPWLQNVGPPKQSLSTQISPLNELHNCRRRSAIPQPDCRAR
jgi:hypothetical protein